jgi:hypothetical protein
MVDRVKIIIVERNGVELEFKEELSLDAENVFFDNSTNGFSSDNTQDAIAEIGASASPGFSFGRSGSLSQNTWLRRPGNVPSNRAGVTIPIANPVITKVSCSNRNVETYDIEIYEHEGNEVNLTLLTTLSVVSARGAIFNVNISATEGKQLAARLGNTSTGNVRDLGVDVVLKGDN